MEQACRDVGEQRGVDEPLQENRRITTEEMVKATTISVGPECDIVRGQLHFRKVCDRWIPSSSSPQLKQQRACSDPERH